MPKFVELTDGINKYLVNVNHIIAITPDGNKTYVYVTTFCKDIDRIICNQDYSLLMSLLKE